MWFAIGLALFVACALTSLFGKVAFGWPWPLSTVSMFVAGAVIFGISLVAQSHRVIRDFPKKGDRHDHFISWKADNYDRSLSGRVRYARHAISIDEIREDFDRVKWGRNSIIRPKESLTDEPLLQYWFAGNHSDIGGSYPETESRLSDITVSWMLEQASSGDLPQTLEIDHRSLNLFPSPRGMQRCEVSAFANAHPQIAKVVNWTTTIRKGMLGATLHPSVLERFALPAVSQCGRLAPYRPPALSDDERVRHYYIGEASK